MTEHHIITSEYAPQLSGTSQCVDAVAGSLFAAGDPMRICPAASREASPGLPGVMVGEAAPASVVALERGVYDARFAIADTIAPSRRPAASSLLAIDARS